MVYRFVSKIKTALTQELAPTRAELIAMKDESQKKGGEAQVRSARWQELNDRMDAKTVSIEIFWREINQLYLLGRPYKDVLDSFVSFTKNSDPFEIIDGDNHSYPVDFLSAAFRGSIFENQRILVIGIIGPQNTGKSTLLNFMFGCVFTASDGRTTKGVYGSLIKSPKDDYDYLLILDTEGIHSVEKNDPEYDRKVVLFTLAVCDVVIINVKDEISQGMRKTFDICAKSLQSLQNNKMPQPVLFFVQNQKANTMNIQMEAMASIIEGMEKDGLGNIITLSSETFVALPSAFNTRDITVTEAHKWRKLDTSPDFIEKVTEFTAKVFNKVQIRQDSLIAAKIEKPFKDLPTWITFSNNVFVTVDKFEDLTRFADIQEQIQDKDVEKWLQDKVSELFKDEKKVELVNLGIDQVTQYFADQQDSLPKALEEVFDTRKISTNLHQRHRSRLELLLLRMRTAWESEARFKIENDRLVRESTNGQYKINKKIDDILRSGKVYLESELEQEFNNTFQECLDDLNKQKQEMEDANKVRSLSLIDTYKLYCSDLPATVKEDIKGYISQSSAKYKQYLIEKIVLDGYSNFLFQTSMPQHINSRLTSDQFQWTLFPSSYVHKLITQAKEIAPKVGKLPSDFCKAIIQGAPILQNKPGIIKKVKKAIENYFLPAPQQTPQIPEMWAVLLVDALRATITHSHSFIADFVNVQLPFELVEAHTSKSGLPASDKIQRKVAHVDKIIQLCNEELACFGLGLTQLTKGNLHMLMLQSLIASQLNFHSDTLEQTVQNFANQKPVCKANFLQQTLKGPHADSASVDVLGKALELSLLDGALNAARASLATRLTSLEKSCTRKYLQDTYERALEKLSPLDILAYVSNPVSVLGSQFDALCQQEVVSITKETTKIYTTKANEIQELANWVGILHGFLRSAKMSTVNEIFFAPAGDAVISLLAKGKAAVLLLADLIVGKPMQQQYTAEGIQLKLQSPPVMTQTHPEKVTADLTLLNLFLENVTRIIQISNLEDFSKKLAVRLQGLADTVREKSASVTMDELDNKKSLPNIRAKAIGCTELCPCCKRCCDVDHTKQSIGAGKDGNKHKCEGGHQFRGMAGYALQNGNYASLKICSEVRDVDKVQLDGQYYAWRDFKLKFATWDFEQPVSATTTVITDLKNKMRYMWEKVGPALCKQYGITYTRDDYYKPELSKHFIFALDVSGSMDKHWAGVKQAVGNFAVGKEKASPVEHLVSCVTFDDTAYETFALVPFTSNVFDKAQFTCGGTNFIAPMKNIVDLVKRTGSNPVVIIFMSDGEASYPLQEINTLVNDNKLWDKIETLWTVGFGSDSPILKRMASDFKKSGVNKGVYKNPKAITELQEQYMEIARKT